MRRFEDFEEVAVWFAMAVVAVAFLLLLAGCGGEGGELGPVDPSGGRACVGEFRHAGDGTAACVPWARAADGGAP